MEKNQKTCEELIQAAQMLSLEGLVTGFGHVSARVSEDQFIITPAKPPGAIEETEELAKVPLSSDQMPPRVPGEVWIHWSIYNRHPNVKAVCRAQPEFAGMLAIAGVPIKPVYGHAAFLGKEVPVFDKVELIRSARLGEELTDALGEASAIIMRGTGSVTVGASLGEAVSLMWVLENNSRMSFFPQLIAEPKTLSAEEVSRWQQLRSELLNRVWEYLSSN